MLIPRGNVIITIIKPDHQLGWLDDTHMIKMKQRRFQHEYSNKITVIYFVHKMDNAIWYHPSYDQYIIIQHWQHNLMYTAIHN